MITPLILSSIAFLLFIVYNSVLLGVCGVPASLSNSFYLYNKIKPNLGYVFTAFMITTSALLMQGWLEVAEVVTDWGTNLQFLSFFTCAAICFVGAAPAFLSNKLEQTVHEVSAGIAAGAALLWCFIVGWQIMYVPIIAMLPPVVIASCTKTWKSAKIYWLEMMAFNATFATVITECILHL